MTTPPDTPKPPADDVFALHCAHGKPVYGRCLDCEKMLAPSPQESHKLAEELEAALRALDNAGIDGEIDSAESDVLNVVCPPNNREIILAALRSSPSEQARDELRNIAFAKRHDPKVFSDDKEFADWAQSRARHTLGAIAASGGAKGDGKG